jgi:hypothetical protein
LACVRSYTALLAAPFPTGVPSLLTGEYPSESWYLDMGTGAAGESKLESDPPSARRSVTGGGGYIELASLYPPIWFPHESSSELTTEVVSLPPS